MAEKTGFPNKEISTDFRALLRGFALSFLLFLPYYILSVCGKHLWAGTIGGLPSPVFHSFIAVTLLSILLALSLLRFNLTGKTTLQKSTDGGEQQNPAAVTSY